MGNPRRITADQIAEVLPGMGSVLVQGCSGASDLLAGAVVAAGEAIGALDFAGIQVGGLNRASWLANKRCRFTTFFMTPELRGQRDQVTFLPLCYADILARWRSDPPTAAIFSVTPPDSEGRCSFGPTVDFLAELWPSIPIRIAQINPLLPRTAGPTFIPFAELTAFLEAETPLPGIFAAPVDAATQAIAANVARFVTDGATIQTGLGKLPDAVLGALGDRRDLRFHSGLAGDAAFALLDRGAIPAGGFTTGVAIGTAELYRSLPNRAVAFRPVSHTHDPAVLAGLHNLVTINSAASVDLFGQAYAEVVGDAWNSGTGGVTDFARGAKAAGGLRIIALPAAAKGASRVGAGFGPVTLGRTDLDIVVTEHGAADLRGLDHDARAAALIAIAAPEHRDPLARAWRDGPGKY